jgi:hypothetical protein
MFKIFAKTVSLVPLLLLSSIGSAQNFDPSELDQVRLSQPKFHLDESIPSRPTISLGAEFTVPLKLLGLAEGDLTLKTSFSAHVTKNEGDTYYPVSMEFSSEVIGGTDQSRLIRTFAKEADFQLSHNPDLRDGFVSLYGEAFLEHVSRFAAASERLTESNPSALYEFSEGIATTVLSAFADSNRREFLLRALADDPGPFPNQSPLSAERRMDLMEYGAKLQLLFIRRIAEATPSNHSGGPIEFILPETDLRRSVLNLPFGDLAVSANGFRTFTVKHADGSFASVPADLVDKLIGFIRTPEASTGIDAGSEFILKCVDRLSKGELPTE